MMISFKNCSVPFFKKRPRVRELGRFFIFQFGKSMQHKFRKVLI